MRYPCVNLFRMPNLSLYLYLSVSASVCICICLYLNIIFFSRTYKLFFVLKVKKKYLMYCFFTLSENFLCNSAAVWTRQPHCFAQNGQSFWPNCELNFAKKTHNQLLTAEMKVNNLKKCVYFHLCAHFIHILCRKGSHKYS